MKIQINTRQALQYFLILIMVAFNCSNLYNWVADINSMIPMLCRIGVICVAGFYILFKKKDINALFFPLLLLFFVAFVRYTAGGVGISPWIQYSSDMLVVFMAISIQRQTFLKNYLKIIYFFALCSLIGYALQLLASDLLKNVLTEYSSTFGFNDWSSGNVIYRAYKGWGLLFFSMRDHEMTRNIGIFSEPGNYQIVLNAGLFVLLFLKEHISLTKKKYKNYVIILTLAILTCQSTTGYLCMMVMYGAYLFQLSRSGESNKLKQYIIGFICVAGLCISIDYSVRGYDSLIYNAVLGKIFNTSGRIDLTYSTGVWRIETLGFAIASMLNNPLGIGYEKYQSIVLTGTGGAAGGALFAMGAVLGVIPFFCVILWYINPIIKDRELTVLAKTALIVNCMYVITAQTLVFYPMLIALPMFLGINNRYSRMYQKWENAEYDK